MIKELLIENFQAHEKLKVLFGDGITVFVGDSDVGKSSVIRALSWVLRNSPSGDSFIRHGTEKAKVTVILKDGTTVARERGVKHNAYYLNGEELKAFGSDVPEPIQKITKINDSNFQFQYDSPYWFNDSGGVVSKRLNQVVDLSIIDESLKKSISLVRTNKEKIVFVKDRIKQYRETKQKTNGCAEAHDEAQELIRSIEALSVCEAHVREIESLVAEASRQQDRIRQIEDFIQEASGLIKELSTLETINSLKYQVALFAKADRIFQDAPMIADFAVLKEEYAEFCIKKEEFERFARIKYVISDVQRMKQLFEEDTTEYEHQKEHFKAQTEGKICPLCKHEL
jgi:AAA15 family ATPase/GTPase